MPFRDNTNAVMSAFDEKTSAGLQAAAKNTVTVADKTAPFKNRGRLKKKSVELKLLGKLSIQITWPAVFTSYQNRGARADGSHRIRRYTTPGTGKGFVDKGIADTRNNFRRFFQ